MSYFSNITDVYEKIRANRRDIDKKCPRTKCDKILNKVKKVKASVEVIQTMNLTVLEQMVEMLKNSSTAQQLLDLEPIKACMADPTVSDVNDISLIVIKVTIIFIDDTTGTIIAIDFTITLTHITDTVIRPSTTDLKAFSSLSYININILITSADTTTQTSSCTSPSPSPSLLFLDTIIAINDTSPSHISALPLSSS